MTEIYNTVCALMCLYQCVRFLSYSDIRCTGVCVCVRVLITIYSCLWLFALSIILHFLTKKTFPPSSSPRTTAAPSSCWGRSLPWTTQSVSRWRCGWVRWTAGCHLRAWSQLSVAEQRHQRQKYKLCQSSCRLVGEVWLSSQTIFQLFSRRLTLPGVKDFRPAIEILSLGRIFS